MPGNTVMGLLVVLVLVAGAAGSWRLGRVFSGSSGPGDGDWALSDHEPPVVSAYLYAGSHRQQAARIPCYCGCWDLGHASLRDCFIAGGGDFEPHASACAVCLDELADLRRILESGEGVEAARAYIDMAYSGLGKPTNTP